MRVLKPDMDIWKDLNPFFHLLFQNDNVIFHVEETTYDKFEPFFKKFNGFCAIDELLFYMENKIYPPNNLEAAQKLLQESKDYFQLMAPLLQLDFSQLQKVKLNFGSGKNFDIPDDLLKYIGGLIEIGIRGEAPDITEKPISETIQDKLKELKDLQKANKQKGTIQKDIPIIEGIIKAKDPLIDLNKTDFTLCTYAIFYEKGYRLTFEDKDKHFLDYDNTNPFDLENFNKDVVYKNVTSHQKTDLN